MDIPSIILSLLLTAVAYVVFPLIRLLINGERFAKNRAHKIALWNSIVLGVAFCIITIAVSEDGTLWNGAPAILYYWINRWILTDKNATEDTMSEDQIYHSQKGEDISKVPNPNTPTVDVVDFSSVNKNKKYTSSDNQKKKKTIIITVILILVVALIAGIIAIVISMNGNSSDADINGNSSNGKHDECIVEPYYIAHRYIEYQKESNAIMFSFALQDENENDLKLDATVELTIKNAYENIVYSGTKYVTSSDYDEWYMVSDPSNEWIATAVYIPISQITNGETPNGTLYYRVTTESGVYFEYSIEIDEGLPIKVEPFETQIYSGHGTGYIKNINLSYGYYNIIFTHNGSSNFVVYLNEELVANEIGEVSFIHQLEPGDNQYYTVGTPLKNGYFNITDADGDWTITIEKIQQ